MPSSRVNLGSVETISTLSQEDLGQFCLKSLPKGSIFYADELSFIILKKGSAKLVFYEDGEEFIIYYMHSNDVTVLDSSCVLELLEDSEFYEADKEAFSQVLKNQKFNDIYRKILLNIVIIQRRILKDILFENAKSRISSFLIELAKEQDLKQSGLYCVFIPFSITIMASFVGLRRQSASSAFNELIKDGIIRKISPHECVIMNFDKLKSFTNPRDKTS